ncbi:flavin reductase [Plantactinospora sp. WMMB334]|uniref:flavin reductase n=1 Tax=Plantactinospora sp. WMMB334 TaxID=3404119 RepID=UPI003B93F5AC
MIGPQERWYRHVARKRRRRRLPDLIGGHLPARTYACSECDHAWPCRPARRALLIGFDGDRLALMMYLAAHLARALAALPDRHPALIVGQILCWVPRRR